MAHRALIALLTDFGTRDHYVGTMKGVMLGVCPDATLVDISHDIPPHDVLAGAFELAASYKYFPNGTIFLVVVDPGVGSARRGVAVECGEYLFVAPDNGVLSIVLDETPARRTVELGERRYARPTISRTFEGRDRFAPAAGWLAKGLELTALGRPAGQLLRLDVPKPAVTGRSIDGQVVRVDRFGNLVTNIDRRTFDGLVGDHSIVIQIEGREVERVVSTYADARTGELCALFGSSDHLELAVNGGSAAALTGSGRGSAVHVGRRA
jgi:S-adenosyl-L-methionine hydrolase (adenosine-forming)